MMQLHHAVISFSPASNQESELEGTIEVKGSQGEEQRRQAVATSNKNIPWRVFISVKKFDERGCVTEDSHIANELYDFLTDKNLSVFLSERSLEVLGASAYKKAIDSALDQCQILIAVGTSAGNLSTGWVQYEWDSFINDIISGLKPEGRVFIYVKDVSIALLPRPLRQSQVFQHQPDEMERLYRFISNALESR